MFAVIIKYLEMGFTPFFGFTLGKINIACDHDSSIVFRYVLNTTNTATQNDFFPFKNNRFSNSNKIRFAMAIASFFGAEKSRRTTISLHQIWPPYLSILYSFGRFGKF